MYFASISIVSSTLEVSSTPPHTSADSTDTGMWSRLIYIISFIRRIASSMYSALNTPPDLCDLLDKVAAQTRNKWTLVAAQLGIKSDHICSIRSVRHTDPMDSYFDVFAAWENKGSPPYTWATIIKALRAPSVGKDQLAKELEEWLLSK